MPDSISVGEALQRGAVEIAHVDAAVEVLKRERLEQPPVLAAGVLAHAVAPPAGVAIDPSERVGMQRRPAAQHARFLVACELDRARLGECRRRLLALAAVDAVDTTKREPRR